MCPTQHANVGIFSINRSEWIKAALGIFHQGLVCVPLYDTLGSTAVEFIVNNAELSTIFVAKNKFKQVSVFDFFE